MKYKTVIIIAASSDIGAHLAEHYSRQGARVIGTFRSMNSELEGLQRAGVSLYPLDINSHDEIAAFARRLRESGVRWDVIVSAPGMLSPIGPFFEVNFDEWEHSVITNSLAQLRVIHALYPLRAATEHSNVIFFAGGGTNGAFDNYSAYCIGKMALIKMTELLDSECEDLQVSIIGTGWVNTKIHLQTLAAGAAAGVNLERTRSFLQAGEEGTTLGTVAECVDWCLSSPRAAVGGRNFSLVHDAWREPSFVADLAREPDTYKLRRKS
jgi:NAD(P)-dependent dehydrogenase (short-subunit alcohol dehydrogenase family)